MTSPLDGLLAGLRLALGTGERESDAARLSGVTDWNAVARLAGYHRVGPLLHQGFELEAARLSGRGIMHRIRQHRDRARIRGLRQLEALKDAAAGFAGEGIPCIVLKGLPLSRRLHGQPFVRESIDIDLLVSPDAFPAAERALRNRGWHRHLPDFRETPLRKRWYETLVKESLFARPDRADGKPGPVLELHRRLLRNPFLLDAPFERLYADGAAVELGGCIFRTLGDDDQLAYLGCHGLEHFWQRLTWLCDFAALVRSMEETRLGEAVARCRADGLSIALAPAFGLCEEALQAAVPLAAAPLPFRGRQSLLVARLARHAWRAPGGWRGVAWSVETQGARIFLKTDVRYRRHELARFVIAPHDFGRFDLPDRLFFLYPLLRPVVWLVKIVRRLRGRGRETGAETARRSNRRAR